MLTELRIEGFKSFGTPSETIKLGPLNVIVGANASGKSNLIGALRFLQYAVISNANAALENHGGTRAVLNRSIGTRGRNVSPMLRFAFQDDFVSRIRPPGEAGSGTDSPEIEITNWRYDLELGFREDGQRTFVSRERVVADAYQGEKVPRPFSLERSEAELVVQDLLSSETRGHSFPINEFEQDQLALSAPFVGVPQHALASRVMNWRFYDLQADAIRGEYKPGYCKSIGYRGESLSVVLARIKERHPDAFRGLVAALRSMVPGIAEVELVDRDGEVGFQIEESYIKEAISSGSVSDGTARLLCLLAIAFANTGSWSDSPLTVIEEPETGLHPHVAEQLVNLLRSASARSQVIVTTHSPALLDYLEPDEIVLCDKAEGLTRMRRASSIEEIEVFRKDFTLGELWQQGALGAVP